MPDRFKARRESPWVSADRMIVLGYAVFFLLLLVLCSRDPTPARWASGLAMALSAVVWGASALYRANWLSAYRRHADGILVAGDPGLELAAYERRVEESGRVLALIHLATIFWSIPVAMMAVALLATSCIIGLFAG